MIRKILQDVLPPERKSIRHIPLPGNRKPFVMEHVEKKQNEEPKPRLTARKKRTFRFSRWGLSIGALILLVVIAFSLSWYFASATVTIKPKQASAVVQVKVEASTQTDVPLSFTLVTATSSASKLIPTTREEDVQRKASGQIVVYNNFSTESQRLIKNTRFEASDGRIYRIDSSVVIPGQKVEGGKKVPGSITVTVYADVAGPEYNLPLSELKGDFTIPGFKGSPRFQSFYARQKTDIVGGFSGRARVVDDATLDIVENEMKTELAEETWRSLLSSVPADYILFKTLSTNTFSVSTRDNPQGDGILVEVVSVGATLAFNKFDLSSYLAEQSLEVYNKEEPVLVEKFDTLSITSSGSLEKTSSGNSVVELTIEGDARFIWQFDDTLLKKALAGKGKKETNSILSDFIAIKQASVIITPSWKSKYPTNLKRIHIELILD